MSERAMRLLASHGLGLPETRDLRSVLRYFHVPERTVRLVTEALLPVDTGLLVAPSCLAVTVWTGGSLRATGIVVKVAVISSICHGWCRVMIISIRIEQEFPLAWESSIQYSTLDLTKFCFITSSSLVCYVQIYVIHSNANSARLRCNWY